jgi:hypothetical protein
MKQDHAVLGVLCLLAACGSYRQAVSASTVLPVSDAIGCFRKEFQARGYKVVQFDLTDGFLTAEKSEESHTSDVTEHRSGRRVEVKAGGAGEAGASVYEFTPSSFVERRTYRGPTFTYGKADAEGVADVEAVSKACSQ